MRITENRTIYMGANQNIDAQKEENAKKNEKSGMIFAGNLKVQQNDILEKQKQAREKALKVVGDAFANEKKIDDDVQARRDHIKELEELATKAQKEIVSFDNEKLALKEQYQITDASIEQKDLELLEKRRDLEKAGQSVFSLPEEELKRLKEIDEIGLTEYQQRSLELDSYKEPFEKEVDEAVKEMNMETAIIQGIALARLKSHPIVDATKEADKILEAASKEAIGMMLEDAKDHVDEEFEEKVEEAKEKKEEEEEKQEKLEEAKGEKEEIPKVPHEDILEQTKVSGDVKSELDNIVKKMKLVAEDIKGAMVDEIV